MKRSGVPATAARGATENPADGAYTAPPADWAAAAGAAVTAETTARRARVRRITRELSGPGPAP